MAKLHGRPVHEPVAQPKRRESGERRIESLLAAAEQVFAEAGYDNATTNHIAKQAGASPGTLYQFFPNKRSLAEHLAARYAAELAELHDRLFQAERLHAPARTLVSRAVEAHVAFHRRRPAFEAIFTAATISPELRRIFLEDVLDRLSRALLVRSAGRVSKADMTVVAEICIMAFRGALPLLSPADPRKKSRIVRELKKLLQRYLEPLMEEGG